MPTNTRWSGQGDWGLSGNAGTARPGIALSNGKQREREKKKKKHNWFTSASDDPLKKLDFGCF